MDILSQNPSDEIIAEHEKDIAAISKKTERLQTRLDKLGVPMTEPIEPTGNNLNDQIAIIAEGMKSLQARFEKLENRNQGKKA